MKLLIVDSTVWAPGRLVPRGYVYIEAGRIVDIGEGDPPPERQAADTLLGGEARLVLPGAVAVIIPELYPARHLLDAFEAVAASKRLHSYFSSKSRVSYYASLMAFYELAVKGFGEVVAIAFNANQVARALTDSGLAGTILVNACSQDESKAIEELRRASSSRVAGRVELGLLLCSETGTPSEAALTGFLEKGSLTLRGPGGTVRLSEGDGLDPLYATALPCPWPHGNKLLNPKGYRRVRELLLLEGFRAIHGVEPLTRGAPATLSVLDMSEPPSLMVSAEDVLETVFSSCPRTETLISRGSIVVDGGQNLYVGSEASSKAREVLVEAYKELKTLV